MSTVTTTTLRVTLTALCACVCVREHLPQQLAIGGDEDDGASRTKTMQQ